MATGGLFGGGTGGAGSSSVHGDSRSNGGLFGSNQVSAGIPDVPKAAVGIFSLSPTPPPATSTPLPTDVAALHSIISTLQAEVKATTSVNTHLAASVARFQAEQATPTPAVTATAPCFHPDHPHTIASGRGAASPEVFKQMSRTNWHGRLGRAHMVDVDALTPATMMELDSLVRRKLQSIFPRGAMHIPTANIEPDNIFACLASLGLRLEDRPRYMDFQTSVGDLIVNDSTDKRARHLTAYFYANLTHKNSGYWRGALVETLIELARYRGLLDDKGYVKEE